MNSHKGIFITFEGPEGAGKTTQMQLLKTYFEEQGRKCVTTREPGGTPLAECLRQMVKHHTGDEPVFNETELLLFAASRAQHVRYLIKPALEQGFIVLCDRFADSTVAYQGFARNQDMDFVKQLNRYVVGDCIPDLTILIDLPSEEGFRRAAARNETDRIESETLAFHHAVRSGFLKIAEQEPDRVKIVPSQDAPEKTFQKILEIIKNAV
ncbi:MAG: dTMP kinase [Victivallaceae bacterium]